MVTREDFDLAVRFLEATKDDPPTEARFSQRQIAGGIVWLYGMDKLSARQAADSAQQIVSGAHPSTTPPEPTT